MFAFSLAFFLGREITLSGQKNEIKKSKQQGEVLLKTLLPEQKQREKVSNYKKILEPQTTLKEEEKKEIKFEEEKAEEEKAEEEKAEEEKAEEEKAEEEKASSLQKEKYTISIKTYEDKNSAIKRSAKIKSQFPRWKVFFKKSKNSYKVYVGSFSNKERAETFLKELLAKPDFSSSTLEKL